MFVINFKQGEMLIGKMRLEFVYSMRSIVWFSLFIIWLCMMCLITWVSYGGLTNSLPHLKRNVLCLKLCMQGTCWPHGSSPKDLSKYNSTHPYIVSAPTLSSKSNISRHEWKQTYATRMCNYAKNKNAMIVSYIDSTKIIARLEGISTIYHTIYTIYCGHNSTRLSL